MKILSLIMTAAVLLLSCDKKEEKSQQNGTVSKTDSVQVTDSSDPSNRTTENTEVREVTPGNTVASNVPSASNGAKPALNPEHGQPFHRCDISVGAPIDSAPQVAKPQMQTNNSSFNTSPISPTPVSVATPVSSPQATGPKPATNPAHGQPHHRCDLQVGAPLT